MKHKINTKYKKIIADLYTPVSIYNKVRDKFSNVLLLESADYHDRTDSKSFICIDPIAGFEAKGNTFKIDFPSKKTKTVTVDNSQEIFHAFQNFTATFEDTPTDLPFNTQGLWGYSSFESVQYMEDIKLTNSYSELKIIQI
jgi:anthranilate synthase component 1